MMCCLWMHLSLLYLLQHSVASDGGVSLQCPKEVAVQKGGNVTINCRIEWKISDTCNVIACRCLYPDDNIECASGKYICNWNDNSHVLLTIVNVSKDENVTVDIEGNCGMDRSPPIRVHVYDKSRRDEPYNPTHLTSSILGVFATIIVVAILLFLIKHCMSKKKSTQHKLLCTGNAVCQTEVVPCPLT